MAAQFINDRLTAAYLREVIDYDDDTGLFYWRRRKAVHHCINVRYAGKQAGHRCRVHGYVLIGIDRYLHRAHRLAWLYIFGVWPDRQVDHINGDKMDNRIANLRLATSTDNHANARTPSHNTSGLKGAFWDKRAERWLAQIKYQGKQHYLGYYDTAEGAHAAYVAAAKRLHGDFLRVEPR